MDPRARWIPTVPLDDETLAMHTHCCYGPNWKVTTLPGTRAKKAPHDPRLREDCIKVVRKLRKLGSIPKAKAVVNTITYRGQPLSAMLEAQQDNMPIQYLKSLLNIPCNNQFEYMGYKMVVNNPIQRRVEVKSANGKFSWYEYLDEERVPFSSANVTGWFDHRGSHVVRISVGYLTRHDLTNLIAVIGNYCKFNWQHSRKTTKFAVARKCKLALQARPYELINASAGAWEVACRVLDKADLDTLNDFPIQADGGTYGGVLVVLPQTAAPDVQKMNFYVKPDWTLISNNPPCRIHWTETVMHASEEELAAE
ncbi:unnamed protein product [Ixodes pacificus]